MQTQFIGIIFSRC